MSWGAHAVGIHVHKVVWIVLVGIVDKNASIVFVLDQPAVPQVADALLVAR